jgi:uncharacterized repeat protein (TIGR03803 family)
MQSLSNGSRARFARYVAYALLVPCAVTFGILPAQTLTKLHDFGGAEGQSPSAVLIQGTNGNLYGTTAGAVPNIGSTIFEITTSGTLTTLHRFCEQEGCQDGRLVVAPLIQTKGGNFYGTAERGGAYRGGAIFEITPGGALTTLVSFCYQADCSYGSEPAAGLVQAPSGKLFGTTTQGGSGAGPYGNGTVFSFIPGGALTTLYSFCLQAGCPDGSLPGDFIHARNGSFYGATLTGGTGSNGGTVFEITPSGSLTTIYNFCSISGCRDGQYPSVLFQAANGRFYGVTSTGGNASNDGTVFELTSEGTLTTLHSFNGAEGAFPTGLIEASDGNFYGTTQIGGTQNAGTVFKMTPSGDFTPLYSFCSQTSCVDGQNPYAGLVQADDGNLYGTTAFGGVNGAGTVFKLLLGLAPL